MHAYNYNCSHGYIATVLALVYTHISIKFIHASEKWLVHSNHMYMCYAYTTHNYDHPNYID